MAHKLTMHTLDEALREEKKSGERLIARLRLMIVLLAFISPLVVILDRRPAGHIYLLASLAAGVIMVTYAGAVVRLLKQGTFHPLLGYLTLFIDAVGLGAFLVSLSFFKPGYHGALEEPLFAIYYIICVSGTVKYDFKYSFISMLTCSGMACTLAGFDATVHAIPAVPSLVAEKILVLAIFTLISVIFHDMFTRIVVAEHQLMSQRVKEISTLLTIGNDISTGTKLEKTLLKIVRETKDLLRSELCYLGLISPNGDQADTIICTGENTPALRTLALTPGQGPEGALIETGKPLMAASLDELQRAFGRRTTDHLRQEDIAALLGVPMRIEGRICGVMLAARRTPTPFSQYDRVLLSTLSQQATLNIHNTMLCEQLQAEHIPFADPAQPSAAEFEGLLGDSPAMQRLCDLIRKSAPTDLPVLIRGESGTGKELVARALHNRGPRPQGPFIPINCAAIPETLLESELFGHERGAFTGASRLKKGTFELADGGTVFLDEIGDMSTGLQIKLLRVLQQQEFVRLGGETPLKVSVRVISATHQNLEQKIARGEFREDLFYRINALTIFTPQLREHKTDIPLMVNHFLQVRARPATKKLDLSRAAMEYLVSREWKGNVRELENLIQRMIAISDGPVVHTAEIKELIAMMSPSTQQDRPENPFAPGANQNALDRFVRGTLDENCSLPDEIARVERELIAQALQRSGGNISRAGRILNVPKSTLFNKIRKYDLPLDSADRHR